jgi:hypothetical protein
MSHQSPYAMHPRPSRAPQHAAVVGGNAVLRGRVQRAMKLIAISCVWVTGLAVVIAAVLMVAVATAPIARNSSAAGARQQPPASQAAMAGTAGADRDPAAAGRSPAGQPARGIAAARSRAGGGQAGGGQAGRSLTHPGRPHDGSTSQLGASAPARIQAVYLGLGSANTSQFTIGGTGTWKLGWSYDCAGTGSPGTFTISQHGPGSGGRAHVGRRGMAGHGVSWARRGAGTHYLAIRTQCRWRLTVASRP